MEKLKKNQILLEISENKDEVTISCGAICHSITYYISSEHITNRLSNYLNDFLKETQLNAYAEWREIENS